MTGVYSEEIINMFLLGQVFGLVENFNIEIYSATITVMKKLNFA